MRDKRNELWKLDLLEAKFTQAQPRFAFTLKLLRARKNTHLMNKLPATPSEAFKQIEGLKTDLFAKKFHGSHKKLLREVSRYTKQELRTWPADHQHLKGLFEDPQFLDKLVTSKLVKTVSSILQKKDRDSPPLYLPQVVAAALSDKTLPYNPSHFFVSYCQNDKAANGVISKMWNSKTIKPLCGEIEWSFKKIRGGLTKQELAARAQTTKAPKKTVTSQASDDETSDSDSDNDDSAKDRFSMYDHMVAGSDNESENESDSNTSDSESDSRSDSAEPSTKVTAPKEKRVLPQLATGYYSGGSDDESDVDNDKIVKEATTVRKNRRGQRARQKIWEQKYGGKANHVVKEHQRVASEREQKQLEFEERQRKRELKAKLAAESGAASSDRMHPSWEAKKKAQEKLKDVKFLGKKIVFD